MIFPEKNHRYKIKNQHKKEIEPSEVFLDHLIKKKEETGLSEKKFETPLNEKITRIVFSCFLFFLLILFFRVAYFQFIKGDVYSKASNQNRTRIQLVVPERGVVYDRNMKQLVWNNSSFNLVCDKRDLLALPSYGLKEIEEIARIIDKDPEEIKDKIENSENPRVLIFSNIPHQVLVLLESRINNFKGCKLESTFNRRYIDGSSLFHVLGFIRKISKEEVEKENNYSINDYIGKSGIEKYYENVLRGTPGKIEREKDAFGKKRGEETLNDPVTGNSLILHLDFGLQEKISESLKKNMERVGAEKAAVIALDPQTGGVIAMNSVPSVDNNFYSQAFTQQQWEEIELSESNLLLNRVTAGNYLTGSTIKPLIALAALEEEIISAEKKIFCPLELCLLNVYTGGRECFKDWEFHGWTDVRRAIAESVNPYFYIIGGGYTRPGFADSRLPSTFRGLGDEKMKKWLELFSWGKKTNIDLPDEKPGRVPDANWKKDHFQSLSEQNWTIGDNYNLSIGQGYIQITPLQIASSVSAIANGGTLYRPQIVNKIIDNSTTFEYVTSTNNFIGKVKKIEPEITRDNLADPQNIQTIKEGMRQAVTSGSARILNNLPFEVAAKTGTAQIPKQDHFHHWVTVFAPYENPEIVLTILVEEVEGLQSITLPVAKEVLEWYFENKQ